MIVIVDYGVGNLGSIHNMFRKVGVDAAVSADSYMIADASHIVLPGVGSFDAGMRTLHASGLIPHLEAAAKNDAKPFLGICLGMQLLGRGSEEGDSPGLGWVDAECRKFRPERGSRLKVPHMGWNDVKVARDNVILDPGPLRFYFLHSYYVRCDRPEDVIGETIHDHEFVSALAHGNIFGVQFHPEKSHRFGMQLFRRFAALT